MSTHQQIAERSLRRAGRSLGQYLPTLPLPTDEDLQDGLVDLLTDLRHYAALKGLDFDEAVRTSLAHFKEESK
jgi:hypothetical protein